MPASTRFLIVAALAGCSPSAADSPASSRDAPPAAPSQSGPLIPAAHVDAAHALALRITRTRNGSNDRLLLDLGKGSAILDLEPAQGTRDAAAGFQGFGDCTLRTQDAKAGGPFVDGVASWLGVPSPPIAEKPAPLEPVPCSYALLGTNTDSAGRAWVVRKLFFESAGGAEIFLRTSPTFDRAELVEKDAEYRPALVRMLASALRDGPLPVTLALGGDAPLATAAPLLPPTRPLPGIARYAGLHDPPGDLAWIGEDLVAMADGTREKSKLVRWSDLDREPELIAAVDGVVETLRADPTGKKVALYVHEKDHSPAGGATIVLVDVASRKAATLKTLARSGVPYPVWSPDGNKVAFAIPWPKTGQHETEMPVVFDAGSGKQIAEASIDVHPHSWDDEGLILGHMALDPWRSEPRYRWNPGAAEPVPYTPGKDAGWYPSPDKQHRVRVEGQTLVIEGKTATRRFEHVEKLVLDHFASNGALWIGPHYLFIDGEQELALDVRTFELRKLFEKPERYFQAVSPSGKLALVREEDGPLRWCRVPQDAAPRKQ